MVAVPLVAGRGFHAYKEALYQGLSHEQCIAALNKEFELSPQQAAMLDKQGTTKLAIEKGRLNAMANAYREAYPDDQHQYKNYITESKITLPLLDEVTYLGYVDCLALDQAGDWWIIETKTASKGTVTADYYERVAFDWQVLGYAALAAEKLGVFPRGIVYDVAIKTKHSQRKGETAQGFINRLTKLYRDEWKSQGLFERHELELSAKNVDKWKKQVTMIASEIKEAHDREEKNWPQNTNNCLGKFGTCSHMPICATGRVDKLIYERKK